MKVFRETERMNVVLDTDTKRIDVTQRWHVEFPCDPDNEAIWLDGRFHNQFKYELESVIQKFWDGKAGLIVESTTDPHLLPHVGETFVIRIKINFVNIQQAAQWRVTVVSIEPNGEDRADTSWARRTMKITTESIHLSEGISSQGYPFRQHIAAHEFGHALGNATQLSNIGMTGDEYPKSSRYHIDRDSIMNIGSNVRRRHYAYIKHLLEECMPNTVFKTVML